MNAFRLTALLVPVAGAIALFATDDVREQKKFTLSETATSTSQYSREHAIDVDDRPGHQIRVYELRYDYQKKDLALAGVAVKQSITRGMSDDVNGSGPFTTYSVFTMEDGSKVFSRSSGTTHQDTDGTRRVILKGVSRVGFSGGPATEREQERRSRPLDRRTLPSGYRSRTQLPASSGSGFSCAGYLPQTWCRIARL